MAVPFRNLTACSQRMAQRDEEHHKQVALAKLPAGRRFAGQSVGCELCVDRILRKRTTLAEYCAPSPSYGGLCVVRANGLRGLVTLVAQPEAHEDGYDQEVKCASRRADY